MHKAMRSTFAESCGKTNEPPQVEALRGFGEGVIFLRGSDRHRSGDLSIFSRTLYQLSYRAR